MTSHKRAQTVAVFALAAAAALAGCRGERSDDPPRQFLPDMDDQEKWKPQQRSEFFADGRTARPVVEGTVPFGRTTLVSDEPWAAGLMAVRADFLKDDPAAFGGVSEGAFVDFIPGTIAVDAALIARGENRFNIYCSVCHGFAGAGDGTVGRRWTGVVPSFHDPKYKDSAQRTGKDGYIFDVIRHGVWDTVEVQGDTVVHSGNQRMPSYGYALSEHDAWAVVAYLRTLQSSRTDDVGAVPVDRREQLERTRPEAPPEAPSGEPEPDANPQEGNR